jgi:hypothetical protein
MPIEFIRGKETKIELVSLTHGAVEIPLAQNFDYSPGFDERRIYEFDNDEIAAVVTNFNGSEVRFDHFDSDNKLVDAMINDVDPASTAILDDPAHYKVVTIFLNIRKLSNNKIFQSVLCKVVTLTGAATAEPVREEATMSRSGISINTYRIKGCALEYTRALRVGSSAFAQGSKNSEVDKVAELYLNNYIVNLSHTPQTINSGDPDLNGKALILVLKNGDVYTKATLSDTTIYIPSSDFSTNDVFEIFTTYVDEDETSLTRSRAIQSDTVIS